MDKNTGGASMTTVIVVAVAAVVFVVRRRRTVRDRRARAIVDDLPDAIDLLLAALRAGHTPILAIELLARHAPLSVREAFRAVLVAWTPASASVPHSTGSLARSVPSHDRSPRSSPMVIASEYPSTRSRINCRSRLAIIDDDRPSRPLENFPFSWPCRWSRAHSPRSWCSSSFR